MRTVSPDYQFPLDCTTPDGYCGPPRHGMGPNEQPTEEQREAMCAVLASHRVASRLDPHTLALGMDSCFSVFADFPKVFTGGFADVVLECGKRSTSVHIATQLAPALTVAHKHFGPVLPQSLIAKLRNRTQTLDTLFELTCMGIFKVCHSLSYEPVLADGKVPDLMISLRGLGDVYIECKSHGHTDSNYQRLFNKWTSLCVDAIANTPLQTLAWEKGLRVEVRISATPTLEDVAQLREHAATATVDQLVRGVTVGKTIQVIAVPRSEACLKGPSFKTQRVLVGNVSTPINDENSHLVAYSWPGLDVKRRRSQRKLLASARRKLTAIPAGAYGLICLDTLGARQLISDVRLAIVRPEFKRIPCVWVNPLNESELVSRTDSEHIRDAVFGPLTHALATDEIEPPSR